MQSPESFPSVEEFIRFAVSLMPPAQEMPPPESSLSLEDFIRIRSHSTPIVVGTAALPPGNQQSGENQEAQGIVIMTIRTGAISESRLRDLLNKDGPLPASKASIEAMPVVKITENGTECSICLTEYEVGREAKEMPCKHRYHSGCIDKWLSIHGSCPVCRYKLPVEEKTSGVQEDGRDGDSVVEEFTVYVGRIGDRGSNSRAASETDS